MPGPDRRGGPWMKTTSASACSTTEMVALGRRPLNCHSPDRSRGKPECPLIVGLLRGTRYRRVVERLWSIGGCGLWTTEGLNPDWCAPKTLGVCLYACAADLVWVKPPRGFVKDRTRGREEWTVSPAPYRSLILQTSHFDKRAQRLPKRPSFRPNPTQQQPEPGEGE